LNYKFTIDCHGGIRLLAMTFMAKYEVTFIYDKSNKKIVERLKSYIDSAKAKVTKEEDWGVKPLAYPIQKLTEAAYLYFEIEADTKGVKTLEEKIKLEEELLRHLLVRVEE